MPEIGKSLLHYSIVEKIGKGGMGEVFRARDQKLGRDVAIKVLPAEFAKDADRVARFQREAKLLASLNHTNIAAIHGLEESGGTNFLVLELVEGETLADRIKAGPIPVEEALKLALQISEALEAAHEKGVIHRDLKPANIKVTPEGKVKVLDFGLAKAFAGEQVDLNLSNSPTLSDMATHQGVILGTAAYMSPEQARGKAVDRRTDIWAFGCVLFEMLTGQVAFQGEDVTEILAAVVKGGANLDLLPAGIHPRVREAIIRCLQRDLRKRYSSITDARYEIEQALADPNGSSALSVAAAEPLTKLRTMLLWAAGVLIVGLIVAGAAVWNLKKPEPREMIRFEYELPAGQQFSHIDYPAISISPDGKQIVYSTPHGLYLRSLNELTAKLIPGTEEQTAQPFFSPDGKWIGYHSVTDSKLKKVDAHGGMPIALCDVGMFYGASWDERNMIEYGPLSGDIMQISANGGTPQSIAESKSGPLIYPQILPDGKTMLCTAATSNTTGKIMVQSLKSGTPKEVLTAFGARYVATGHLIYRVRNNLCAVPFSLEKLEVTGEQVPVVEGVRQAAISDSGTLVYIPGGYIAAGPRLTLVWVGRDGKETPISAVPNEYNYPARISPDGTRLALSIVTGENSSIWIWDFFRETMTRLTFDEGENAWPLWTPDSKQIVYRSARDHIHYDIKRKAADGAGEVEKLGSLPNLPGPFAWSKDGEMILSWDLTISPLQTDITTFSFEGDHAQKPLLQSKYNEDHPQISRDGRWMAYASNESGQNEVYMRRFPEVNKGRWQVSTSGGNGPLWSPDGRELYYRNGDSVIAVSVETEPVFKAGKPRELFRGSYYTENVGQAALPMWDISPDGKRFLMMKEISSPSTGESPRKINVVVNWFEELKQRVPTK